MYGSVSKLVSIFRDNNSFNVTPESERDTLIDLEFISRIRVGQKVNVRYRFLQNDGMVTAFSRTFWNIDNKDNTLSFCDTTIRKSINVIKLSEADMTRYTDNSVDYNKAYSKVRRIIKLLCKASVGLSNLQITYTGYDRFISQMEHLSNEIDAELGPRLEKYFPEGDHNDPLSPDYGPSIHKITEPPPLNINKTTDSSSQNLLPSPPKDSP